MWWLIPLIVGGVWWLTKEEGPGFSPRVNKLWNEAAKQLQLADQAASRGDLVASAVAGMKAEIAFKMMQQLSSEAGSKFEAQFRPILTKLKAYFNANLARIKEDIRYRMQADIQRYQQMLQAA